MPMIEENIHKDHEDCKIAFILQNQKSLDTIQNYQFKISQLEMQKLIFDLIILNH